MGTDDRPPATALIALLLERPQSFDLFQAIHLLEKSQHGSRPLGQGDGTNEAVRFSGHVSLAFEPSDIRSVRRRVRVDGTPVHAHLPRPREDAPPSTEGDDAPDAPARLDTPGSRATYTLSTAAMTLAGANGPLPLPFTELVLARRAARDSAMADLLDIFNHRFLSFLYRSRQKHAPALNGRAPDDATLATCLDALGNLGLRDGERGPGGVRLWLRHAGLFGGAPRSMAGLIALLSDRLGTRVRGTQFIGGWREIDARDTLRLSRAGSGAPRLGGILVVGRRSWDQGAGIRIEFVDLTQEQFMSLLPGGGAHEVAAWMIRAYLQQDLDVQFALSPREWHTPCVVTRGARAARLGWTSWLTGAAEANPAARSSTSAARRAPVVLSLRAAAAAAAA